jgi:putative phosphoribosyl transferase
VSDVVGAEPSSQEQVLEDRADAGRRLAARLEPYRLAVPVVLGIPRGGIPVGYEIARRLGCELDVLLVRKVGAPGDPEYGLGAVAEGGVVVVDERRTRLAGWSREDLEPTVRRELEEVTERAARYRGARPPPEVSGRTVIVVDDGVATGGTVETGIAVVRARKPRTIIVALGVAPSEALERLREAADDVVVALVPRFLEAVGQWYRRFDPVDDREVVRLLESARSWTRPNPSRSDAPGLR